MSLTTVVSADESKTRITYISYVPNAAFEMAGQTNDYSDLIEYTYINYYNSSADDGISDDLRNAAENGFLQTQDVIFCDYLGSTILNAPVIEEALTNAQENGAYVYALRTMGTAPQYPDYISDGTSNDPICNYFMNMGTEGEGLENAEELLTYLTMKNKVTFISYVPNAAFEMASQTNDYSDLIEYTYINYYNSSADDGISDDLRNAAENGFLQTQDVIFCDYLGSTILNAQAINESLRNAQENGAEVYALRTMGTAPQYPDYISDGTSNDPICNYFMNMGTEGEGLENAEELLTYLTMKNKVTFISYVPNAAFEMASQTNDYSDLIEYTYINYYNSSADDGISDDLRNAAENGFLQTQDVIFCDYLGSTILNAQAINESLRNAQENGAEVYALRTMGTAPQYPDYISDGTSNDPICNYFMNMGTEGEGLENAEELLTYLTMKNKVTFISYVPNAAFEMASQTNDYSDLIEYTYINYYNSSSDDGISDDLRNAAENGFLQTQDVIFCDYLGSTILNAQAINESLRNAQENGAEVYALRTMGTAPQYPDYISDGTSNDPICNYFMNMGTEGEGLENAEELLTYLTMKNKVTFISYVPNAAFEMASQTNDYSDLIEYTYINYYNSSADDGISDNLRNAAENGFLQTQDVIFCDYLGSTILNAQAINESLRNAQENGAEVYALRTMGTAPQYPDYISDGTSNDPICNYFMNMGTEGEGLENAEELLTYLATNGPELLRTVMFGNTKVDSSKFLFILGTEFNEPALNNAAMDANISAQLDITIYTKDDTVPDDLDFSNYGVIFIESQDENVVDGWTSSIKSPKTGGAKVIGYNLSSNITLSNVDLYSDEYTDIERYWIQGGEDNMESMLKLMGQTFSGSLEGEQIPEPVILHQKLNMTFVIGADSNIHNLDTVIDGRNVITDCFNINIMAARDAVEELTDASDQDFIVVYMVGASDISSLLDVLSDAKANGAHISLGASEDMYGITTVDTLNPPHDEMIRYLENDGATNMENLVRYMGAELCDVYIEHSPAAAPEIPDDGIYHPDAFPHVFADSTEYLEWYADHGYNASAPTIGIVNYEIQKEPIYLTTDDAIIRYLESKGCNVIYSTDMVCNNDVDYFIKDGEVLVDAIIHLKAFYLNYEDPYKGVEYLQKYNVPILKGIQDPYTTPEEYYDSIHGTNPMSLPAMVTQPEVDGCIDFIWISGRVATPDDENLYYYQPIMSQVEFLCDRAIGWAELGKVSNEDKKISILYYNHDGGKDNIGASYLDIGSSFTLLLDRMEAEGYDIGNDTIPNGSEFIDLFITSRNVGAWAPGELDKVVESGLVTLLPVEEYLPWYNTLPESVRYDVEETWGEAPGDIMVYENESGKYFVMPTVQIGNVNFMPQPTKAKLSDESLIYHNDSIPLTHQYLATYFWINNVYDADAIIHFGTHGTLEWSSGKEIGLWEYDYPSICADDTPIIYPYIMDNVGEGSQAKHRGYAVMIDHLTPPIISAGIYGDLTTMHDKIHSYNTAMSQNDTSMAALYRNSTIQLYDNLSLGVDLDVSTDELYNMTDTDFDDFVSNTVHEYLHKLQDTLMPYGVHTFGVAPDDEKLVGMVKSMLKDDFTNHIYNVLSKDSGIEEDWEKEAEADAMLLLNATLLNGTNVSDAQLEIFGFTDDSITADLELAIEYADNLAMTTREIDQTIRALDAEYIEPGPGNDPIRNSDALPTGRNFYGFDQRKFPDVETGIMGSLLADQLVEDYYSNNGAYPEKVSYVLWAMETLRHGGLMEAQIHSLLGVEPERDDGRIIGFTVIPLEKMDHPRIDVMIHSSGLYRDTFPYQLQLIDEAVRMVAELDESTEDNYVRRNSLAMEEQLLAMGYDESTADYLSKCRIFSEAPGNYDNGMEDAIAASETWDNESKLADLFISTSSYVYGQDVWGDGYEDLFKLNLMDIDAGVHSDSSNLFGLLDGDGYYGYLGSIGLTVRVLTGETPDLYIANQETTDGLEVMTLKDALRTELRSRDFNPKWITGMMEGDYAGARQMVKMVEYLWGWDVTNPDLITDSDWNEIHDVYFNDKYDLGIDEFLTTENPYSGQSIMARMIETARKTDAEGNPYWDASDAVLNDLVKRYVESVVENGVTCCHHTCGNPKLDGFITESMADAGVSQEVQDAYKQLMYEATLRDDFKVQQPETYSVTVKDDSLNSVQRAMASGSGSSNQTMMTDSGGAGVDSNTPVQDSAKSTPDNYIEGYEMTSESVVNNDSPNSSSVSSSDIVASVFVLGAVGAMYVGFWKRRKF
ncbi:cobaltochelatase subunit CobN [uncultured Methanolobus sp.]|uniref:cobaltochelatase subunit CobN n=1 Tax=uncultured Methanolobus sp. TaxID=218300 RepID=UPI0029C85146|nr:cobaltochelatase subunit CobN [uncultured Methanolobus sp.]